MLAEHLNAVLARRGIHYAWVVAALTFLTMLTTAGAMGLPGALILPLHAEYGWSTATISSALALRIMLFGLMAPFSAALLTRFGLRAVITTAVILISAGLLLATAMTAFWQLLLLWGVVVGLGTGLTAMVLGATVANRWFVKNRGLVLGLLTASGATGQLAFLPLATLLVQHVGWRAAVVPTVVACAAVAGLVALFMCDRPERLGLAAYGEDPETAAAQAAAQVAVADRQGPVARAFGVLREAAQVPAFWALFATFFICGLSTNGLIQSHFISFCADYGLGETDAASVLAMMGIFDFFGTVGVGLALGSCRQSLAPLLVLRAAGPFAALAAALDVHVLRPLALRHVLWARLDRDRAAHGSVDGQDLRSRKGAAGLRLGVHGPSDRRRGRDLRGRSGANRALDLPAGLLRRRRHVPGRGAGGPRGRPAPAADAPGPGSPRTAAGVTGGHRSRGTALDGRSTPEI